MMRRATGLPGASRRVPTYEDTELEHSSSTSSSASPNKPNLRKSSSPASPYHIGGAQRKSREVSPKLPSPYQPRKQQLSVSQSIGDVGDLAKRGSQHSSNSSLDQSDNDAYEPIADFLRGSPNTSSSVPAPKQGGGGGGGLSEPQQEVEALIGGTPSSSSQSTFNAPPSYPAPVPPAIPPKTGGGIRKSLISERLEEKAEDVEEEEEDDDDDGYTQVNLEGGQVEIPEFTDDVERAVLPLLSSSTSARSSVVGGDSADSSPMRHERGAPPPDVVPSGFAGVGSSPKLGVPKGGSGGKGTMPPEPTSPPPSPPTGGRGSAVSSGGNPSSPPVPIVSPGKPPSPLLSQRITTDGSSPISPPTVSAEQPKLPPKKRNKQPSISSSQMKDDDIYAFDNLSAAKPGPTLSSSPKPQAAPPPVDDDIYSFDTLQEKPPQVPKKSESFKASASFAGIKSPPPYQPKPSASSSSVKPAVTFVPSYSDENIYEFDSLEEAPPTAPKKVTTSPSFRHTGFNVNMSSSSSISQPLGRSVGGVPPKPNEPPPIPRKSLGSSSRSSFVGTPGSAPSQPAMQFHDDDNVYTFDSLVAISPSMPKKSSPSPGRFGSVSEKPQVQMHDDNDIYAFDTLDPPQLGASSGGPKFDGGLALKGLSPETGQLGDTTGGGNSPDQVYFDHLATGQPPSVGGVGGQQRPSLPPRPSAMAKSPFGKPGGVPGKPPHPGIPPKTSPPTQKKIKTVSV